MRDAKAGRGEGGSWDVLYCSLDFLLCSVSKLLRG